MPQGYTDANFMARRWCLKPVREPFPWLIGFEWYMNCTVANTEVALVLESGDWQGERQSHPWYYQRPANEGRGRRVIET